MVGHKRSLYLYPEYLKGKYRRALKKYLDLKVELPAGLESPRMGQSLCVTIVARYIRQALYTAAGCNYEEKETEKNLGPWRSDGLIRYLIQIWKIWSKFQDFATGTETTIEKVSLSFASGLQPTGDLRLSLMLDLNLNLSLNLNLNLNLSLSLNLNLNSNSNSRLNLNLCLNLIGIQIRFWTQDWLWKQKLNLK